MADIAKAPFTEDQVRSLEAYQDQAPLPYVCPRHGTGQKLKPAAHGLTCELCHMVQDWAHVETLNWKWQSPAPQK